MVYKKHIFVCTSCKKGENATSQGDAFFKEIKNKTNKQEFKNKGHRLSSSGCVGLGSKGIKSVIYPEAKFLHELNFNQGSINKIIEELN